MKSFKAIYVELQATLTDDACNVKKKRRKQRKSFWYSKHTETMQQSSTNWWYSSECSSIASEGK